MKPSDYQKLADNPVRSVVLIDEIDKAPREVPNDILNEIETMAFTIPELASKEVKLNTQATENRQPEPRPIVIITSNSERDLPEAFLRRCVFYHLPFPPFDGPEGEVTVRSIVQARFAKRFVNKSPLLEDILSLCECVRKEEQRLSKLPSLAELLNWIELLFKMNFESDKGLEQKGFDLIESLFLPVLLKTIDDQAIAKTLLQQWWTKNKGAK